MRNRMARRVFWGVIILIGSISDSFGAERSPRPIPTGADPRERFLKLVDRPRVPLAAEERAGKPFDGVIETHIEFDSEANQRVTGIVVKASSATGRLPSVFVLHGTGGKKESMRPLLQKLASRGFAAVAIDGRFSGERDRGGKGSDSYRNAIFETWETGKGFPFLYDTVWDVLSLIDYLETRPDIDAARIGAIGFSKGGMELYLAAAVDPRIAASVPCIGVQSFGWALEHDAWHSRIGTIQTAVEAASKEQGISKIDADFIGRFYDRVVPGVQREFDGPVMLPLIAPRPLLVINGDHDDRTPQPGLELCVSAAKAAYSRSHAEQQFEFILQSNTGHAVNLHSQEYAVDWLTKHLKASSPN